MFVGGLGRSGSTLLDRMLGEMPGVCAVGEVVHLWERGLGNGERCGCGLPFGQCEFWLRVGKEAFDGWSNVDVRRVAVLRQRVDRTRHILRMALPELPAGIRADLAEYAGYYARVYQAVRQVSGCDLVVESSKHASLAFALRWAPDVDLRVLQLVRDSPGVAHSWAKQVRRPDVIDDGEEWMARCSPAKVSLQWAAQNAAFDLLAATRVPVRRERYEDLVADPIAVLGRIRGFAQLPHDPTATSFVTGDVVHLKTGHTVSGNPMRFASGPVQLRRDDAWRSELPVARRRLVSALTLPLRLRYGYLRTPGK
ncbi:MAG: sulfotransferase family protein [Pseudonocardiales bacterium]|nr:MAG: sulfotransferase family protein [Pseudonocardiales bacterium]